MKQSWPFRLGTTSFIYPDHIIPNVRKLGKNFDEIELLIFESIPEQVLPSENEIKELVYLADEFNISYNIHLPTDISLVDIVPKNRTKAIDTIKKVMDLCAPLKPTTHTLHLDFTCQDTEKGRDGIHKWRERASQSLNCLASSIPDPDAVSIETLDYPFEYLDGLIESHDFSVCIDAGHLIKYKFDILKLFNKYQNRIPLIHLHGVDFSTSPPKDHVGLDKTPDGMIKDTIVVLEQFKGVVSLEVFNYKNLSASLDYLHRI